MDLIEKAAEFSGRFSKWNANENLSGYPFVENVHAPFTPIRRALPMLNLALISSAGAYIDGTDPFDIDSRDGDLNYREIPVEVEAQDLQYAAKGYEPKGVRTDRNTQIPIDRLLEYQANSVIGSLNNVWWSISSWIPNARGVAEHGFMLPSSIGALGLGVMAGALEMHHGAIEALYTMVGVSILALGHRLNCIAAD